MKRHPHPFCAKAVAGLLAIALPLGSVWGQDSLQVTFVGDRELEVRDVVKPASSPTRVDLGMAKPTIDYAPIAKSIAPVTQVRTIEPFAVRMDAPLPRLYAGYAKGGFGLYTSPFADIHYGETQSRKGSWGVNLVHRSSAGSTGQVDSLGLDEGWSHNVLQGHYKRFIDRSSLTLEGGIERDAWGIHGLDLSMVDPITFAALTADRPIPVSTPRRAFKITSGTAPRSNGTCSSPHPGSPRPEPGSGQRGHARDPAQPRPGEPGDGHRRVPDLAG